ncbi:hypothetical protein JOE66_002105 [Subtercola frigoramans]|uniref:Uncharacterized protein n=1 Tax=Subtercola frigoramans TaxID=120298 RepID=A0ABS2L7N3_9MICO|nr:hypothetical protein [Subtercola frigoramans]
MSGKAIVSLAVLSAVIVVAGPVYVGMPATVGLSASEGWAKLLANGAGSIIALAIAWAVCLVAIVSCPH